MYKNTCGEAEKMAQLIRAWPALPQDPGSNPSTHMEDTCNPSLRGSYALFWPPWVQHICDTHTYTQGHTHIK